MLDKDSVDNLTKLARTDLQEYWELTIQDFDTLVTKPYTLKKEHFALGEHISVLQHFWFIGFLQFVQGEFVPTLDKLQTPSSLVKSYERQAKRQLLPTTLVENLLIFARSYFGLSSFDKASRTPLAEVVLALKDRTNNDIYQRVSTNLQIKQMKAKR